LSKKLFGWAAVPSPAAASLMKRAWTRGTAALRTGAATGAARRTAVRATEDPTRENIFPSKNSTHAAFLDVVGNNNACTCVRASKFAVFKL